jgi:hypothetical protein
MTRRRPETRADPSRSLPVPKIDVRSSSYLTLHVLRVGRAGEGGAACELAGKGDFTLLGGKHPGVAAVTSRPQAARSGEPAPPDAAWLSGLLLQR